MPGEKKAPAAGTKGSKPKVAKFEDKASAYLHDWQVEKTLPADSPFGVAYVMAHVKDNSDSAMDKTHVLMKENISSNEKDAAAFEMSMRARFAMVHQHIQKLNDWSGETKSDWCSKFYKLKAFYEYPESNFRQRIGELGDKEVPHEELTHVMYQMIGALAFLHDRQIAFNDVRPEYVGVRGPHDYILCDRLRFPGNAIQSQRENFQAVFGQGVARRLYTAPEVWAVVNSDAKKAPPKIDEAKADIWSYGLMILSGGLGLTVKEHNTIFQRAAKGKPATVNHQQIEQWVEKFKTVYEKDNNSILGLVVGHCLEVDPNARPSAHDILTVQLPPYQEVLDHFHGVVHHEPHVGATRPHHEVVHVEPRHDHVHVGAEHTHVIHHGDHSHIVHHVEPAHHHEHVVHGEENVRIIRGEPIIRRTHGETHSHVKEVVVEDGHGKHHHETVVETHAGAHVHTNPVRASHTNVVRGEPRIIRGEPRIIRADGGKSHTEHVVTGDVHRSHTEHRVIRREPSHTHAHVKDVVVDDGHGKHHHETVVETHAGAHCHTNPVVRTSEATVVRGEPRIIRGEPVVRRSHHGETVRTSHHGHVVGGHSHVVAGHTHGHVVEGHSHVVEGHSHVVTGHTHTHGTEHSNVRVIKDPAEVARYKEKMAAEGKTFGTSHAKPAEEHHDAPKAEAPKHE